MTETLRVEATSMAGGLVLRPWHPDDAEGVIEAYRGPGMSLWTTRSIETYEDALSWIELQRQDRERGIRLGFAVCEVQPGGGEGELLGNVVLKWHEHPSREAGEVGYWTMPHARGRGVAPRAVEALSTWAFDIFAAEGLRRLVLFHQVDNLASCRVAEKSGFRFDRVLPPIPPYPKDGHLHVRHVRAAGR
ncbi:GNAT family N-acetyltransferase [Streptomyces sp. NPDC048416]|uniref:GNAT family N-acetyltransferase n=1 Tax=Streptomyces sp. NPDC048416 TaxID=3365546 RepID=UPI00371B92E7